MLASVFAGVALGCSLIGLFSGARRAFDSAEWYICTTGFIMVVNGKGEAVSWDQVEGYKWDTKPDNQHDGWMCRLRHSDGKVFWVNWRGQRTVCKHGTSSGLPLRRHVADSRTGRRARVGAAGSTRREASQDGERWIASRTCAIDQPPSRSAAIG